MPVARVFLLTVKEAAEGFFFSYGVGIGLVEPKIGWIG